MEAVSFSAADVSAMAAGYDAIARRVPLHPIRTTADYDAAVQAMDALLDAGGAAEQHSLAGLVALLGELIAEYDDTHYRLAEVAAPDTLRALIDLHGVKQNDLPEIGSQGVVSEILSGKRKLNAAQIKRVSDRFGVSPAVFF